ncbi:MAG TPA: nitrite reductase small subunit NirD [Azospira sp.]|nr:nitrite reductase small subunit NirD [Azospira sp.]
METTQMTQKTAGYWKHVCALTDIPVLGSRVVRSAAGDIAVFRNTEDEVFAVHDKCPHKGGPLSQGIVHGRTVTCPLHSWKIHLESGEAVAPDVGCTKPFQVKLEAGQVWLAL